MLHTENAGMLAVFYLNTLFLPFGQMLSKRWVVFRVVTGKLSYYWALCRNSPSCLHMLCPPPPPQFFAFGPHIPLPM